MMEGDIIEPCYAVIFGEQRRRQEIHRSRPGHEVRQLAGRHSSSPSGPSLFTRATTCRSHSKGRMIVGASCSFAKGTMNGFLQELVECLKL